MSGMGARYSISTMAFRRSVVDSVDDGNYHGSEALTQRYPIELSSKHFRSFWNRTQLNLPSDLA